jgi:hypothetical protein
MAMPSDSDEDAWIQNQRAVVEEYLARQGCDHLGVGEYPAFHVHPYVALWAVQSKSWPGQVGWWATSGDLPTDYISGDEATNPHEAIRSFSRHWQEVSGCMLRGEEHPDYAFGPPDRRLEFGEMLKSRADVLQKFADLDGLWDEDGGPSLEPDEEA